ncbi:MAG: cation transporter [Schwartzia sp.]|nr:cation transporter [Schwartzia sp. (in: firmicutes)]
MANESEQPNLSAQSRDKIIIRTSVIGILANVLLAAAKAAIGMAANSIAVILDAVNNLSDAMSSVITILGAKLAGKAPDKEHPLGYGRVEYLSAMIVSGLVLYAGITSAVESVKKIVSPETADYDTTGLVVIAVAIVVKIVLGRYVKAQGEKANSGALIASGADASFDAILSLSVLASALVFIYTGVSLEAYVGAVISGFIIKSGIDMMKETLDDILGVRMDRELSRQIKSLLAEEPEVRGAYDLVLHNYGPDTNLGSVHLELPDTMTVKEVDALTRRVERKVMDATGVFLVGVGVYSHNTGDGEAADMQKKVREIVMAHDWALQFHGFYVDTERKTLRCDVVMSFDIDRGEGVRVLTEKIRVAYPGYAVHVAPDVDISD